jgi:hypothetical protein
MEYSKVIDKLAKMEMLVERLSIENEKQQSKINELQQKLEEVGSRQWKNNRKNNSTGLLRDAMPNDTFDQLFGDETRQRRESSFQRFYENIAVFIGLKKISAVASNNRKNPRIGILPFGEMSIEEFECLKAAVAEIAPILCQHKARLGKIRKEKPPTA